MLVTDLAMREMSDQGDALLERIVHWLTSPFRHRSPVNSQHGLTMASNAPVTLVSTGDQDQPIDFIRHRSSGACRRAFRLAGDGRYDEARSAFHTAIATDPGLDPTLIAGFWDLPRRGMFAAIEAYEDLGRYRDATALELRILQASRASLGNVEASAGR